MNNITSTEVVVRDRRMVCIDFEEAKVGAYFLWNGDLYRKVKTPDDRVYAMRVRDSHFDTFGDNDQVEIVPIVQVLMYPEVG